MKRTLTAAIGAALFGLSGAACAINDLEANASIPFNFSNPGARSLGMGGAFVGLADDATAAYTNPAGLAQLRQPEIAIEGRHTAFSTPYVNGGNLTTQPAFSTAGLDIRDADSSTNNLSYLSFVLPRERWAFSLYRHEVSNFDSYFRLDDALTFDGLALFSTESSIDLKIVNWGAAAAFRASDRVSLGLGISRYDFDIYSNTGRYFPQRPLRVQTALQYGSDNGLGWNLGARFALTQALSLGVSYRHAPRFYYAASVTNLSNGTTPLPQPDRQYFSDHIRFDVPDVWGAGLSWRPSDNLVVNFDVDRVMYSELTDGISTFFDPAAASRLRLDDGTEYHLGAEYTFSSMQHPFSLRGGVWRDPRHAIRFEGVPPANATDFVSLEELFASQYAGGRGAETHYAIGGGWAFSQFQLDLAADLSDGIDTYSVSGVYRF